ncbi:hmg box protein [Sporothrix brasiliensis 5110]|uniref:Hmg box protein n=1 Tax=Sporothrix brasiliensis 5110 TaxID=1398154 RepID=A0A0C2IRQ7_9PEZI|nr:hmg box protein [Sporothrix brasiliensis 5110]KIH89565.1 hmg box protein [Sporothrix brasiliensis 5110]
MARPSKKQLAEAAKADAPKVIDVENFIRVRDSVYARLSTIQELLKNFSGEYLRQTNLLLGEGAGVDGVGELIGFDTGLLPPVGTVLPPVAVAVAPAADEKKERKKRTHDPNAPKRPLTPYFLYMQTARPIIANDLGPEAPKGAVQEEGQRRWSTMNAHDKGGWDRAYQYNLRLYNARVHSYKSGNANARLMSDEEALRYADEFHIPMPTSKEADTGNDQDAIAEQLQQGAADDSAKTPKSAKKDNRKRKTATPGAEAEPVKGAAPASPDKKRKRTSKVTRA